MYFFLSFLPNINYRISCCSFVLLSRRVPFLDNMDLIKTSQLKGQLRHQVYTLRDSRASGGTRRDEYVIEAGRGRICLMGPFPLLDQACRCCSRTELCYQQYPLSMPFFPSFLIVQVICVSLCGFTGWYHVMEKAPGLTIRTSLDSAVSYRTSRNLLSHFTSPNSTSGS